jgi:uncharacterized membrane protein
MSLMSFFDQPVTPYIDLMNFTGSIFQFIIFSAGALLALAIIVVVWLCIKEMIPDFESHSFKALLKQIIFMNNSGKLLLILF